MLHFHWEYEMGFPRPSWPGDGWLHTPFQGRRHPHGKKAQTWGPQGAGFALVLWLHSTRGQAGQSY